MTKMIHVTHENGDTVLVGVHAIKHIMHKEFTPVVPKHIAEHPDHKATPIPAPAPVIGSEITFMDGKTMIVKEPPHKISDMQ
jgi:uncharacterized protein YlzI (FlbEa/FlbD family)